MKRMKDDSSMKNKESKSNKVNADAMQKKEERKPRATKVNAKKGKRK